MTDFPFGLKIKKWRTQRGFSVEELAKELDISPEWLRKLENGQGTFKKDQLEIIYKVLKISEDHLNYFDHIFSVTNNNTQGNNVAANNYYQGNHPEANSREIELYEKLLLEKDSKYKILEEEFIHLKEQIIEMRKKEINH